MREAKARKGLQRHIWNGIIRYVNFIFSLFPGSSKHSCVRQSSVGFTDIVTHQDK